MKHIIYNIAGLSLSAVLAMSATSCTDYLDRDPSIEVSETVAFQNFTNFQGFIEEMYNCIPEKESCFWCTTFNWGEDEIMNDGAGNTHLSHQMDLGNYRHWMNDAQNYLGGNGVSSTSGDKFSHRIYDHSWYCIRKCNYGLKAMEDGLFVGSKEEQNILLGQLYFFRAWWHNEVMMYFGGMPYIDKVLDSGEEMKFARLSYQECARKAADDFKMAASLLPLDWDKSGPGKKTSGHNQIRVTRTAALAYAGKCLLWAASPLMENHDQGVMSAGDMTYKYNTALAQEAAECLGTALNEVEAGKTPYSLCSYEYEDIYNHEKAAGVTNSFTDIFYTTGQGWKQPGSTEAIFRGPQPDVNGSNWNFAKLWGSKIDGFVEHDKIIHMPTANYVNYAYGMANGLPITDPNSGFDPTHPFKDRDPRFYHDIVFDGMRVATTEISDNSPERVQQYADFRTGSPLRNAELGSRSGYFCQKLVSKSANKFDKMYDWAGALECYLPYLRLADIYLMYAEATVAAKQGNGTVTYKGSAVDAINVLRDRVGAGHVDDGYTGDYHKLMDEIRRERACELAFEGFRWNDLQRWILLTDPRFNKKTSQEFGRALADRLIESKAGNLNAQGQEWKASDGETKYMYVENAWYVENDPRDAEVTGWSEKVICDRLLGTKHYWFPLPNKDVYLYPEFNQNPGW